MDRENLCNLIPHTGDMCLLEAIEDWGEDWIRCRTGCHRWPNNPLARNGRLDTIHALEIGAQAVAAHGGVLASRNEDAAARIKYLAAIRYLELEPGPLDQLGGDLTVNAHCLGAQGKHGIYHVEVASDEATILSAQVTVMGKGE